MSHDRASVLQPGQLSETLPQKKERKKEGKTFGRNEEKMLGGFKFLNISGWEQRLMPVITALWEASGRRIA